MHICRVVQFLTLINYHLTLSLLLLTSCICICVTGTHLGSAEDITVNLILCKHERL